jgi:hypothetical protein
MNLHWIETGQCMFCILSEDDKHMLFSCEHKAVIWFDLKFILDPLVKSHYINYIEISQHST